MIELSTHQMTSDELEHWSPGDYLGAGCDKVCFAALYNGEETPYVIKLQRHDPIYDQVEVEVNMQDELLLSLPDPAAKAALSRIAYILGIGYKKIKVTEELKDMHYCFDRYEDDEEVDFLVQICERANMEHESWGGRDLCEEATTDGAIPKISDMGERNYGRRWCDGTWICLDWGVSSVRQLLDMGKYVAQKEGWN